MNSYRFFDHTADIGIEISGRTKKDLFVNAVNALFDVMIASKTGREAAKKHKKIVVEGEDTADLLINFLREILYLFNGEKFVTSDCEIKEISNKKLTARLTGEPFDEMKHAIKMEIKAVTYSGVNVKKQKTGWGTRVIFDV